MAAGIALGAAGTAFIAFTGLAGFLAATAERTGGFLALGAFLATALPVLLSRVFATETRVAFEDFAIVLRRACRLAAPLTLRGYHCFEQKNSGLKSSSSVLAHPAGCGRMTILFELWPQLRARVPWVSLGQWPTRVERASQILPGAELWLKRDDLSSSIYGGNKLRLLEHLLAEAREQGATQVFSSGALGSNFSVATALHAPRLGLKAGAICFPQPLTPEGERGQRVVAARAEVVTISHWSLLPIATERVRRRDAHVLSQVSLGPNGLLGYVAAGLELAQQIKVGECPAPQRIVLPIGSAATSAGILAGLSLAKRLGILQAMPQLCPVRIAAFPLSRRGRVLSLALSATARLAELTGDARQALAKHELLPLSIVTDQLGAGYPEPTPAGAVAQAAFTQAGYPILDGTYSAKAAAHVFAEPAPGPVLFWCTKSSAPLPDAP